MMLGNGTEGTGQGEKGHDIRERMLDQDQPVCVGLQTSDEHITKGPKKVV